MNNKIIYFGVLFLVLFSNGIQAQKNENNTIGTQEVFIIKSYTPSLSDAFNVAILFLPTTPFLVVGLDLKVSYILMFLAL